MGKADGVETDWSDAPVFGAAPKGVSAFIRPSAYAVIRNDHGALAIVRTPEGAYLPGGGMDPGESIADTVIRETLEECGLRLRAGSRIAVAVQFAWSEAEQTYFEKRCTFVDAMVVGPDESKLQPDHEVLWVDAETAQAMLTHEAHSWVISQVR